MRVLVLSQMYPPHYLGGYELACFDVVERWSARGHDVEVLTTTFHLSEAMRDPVPSVPVRRELAFYWEEHQIVTPSIRERIRIERANQASIVKALDEVRPDVVSVWHMGAMSLGVLQTVVERHVPIVVVVADQWLLYGGAVDAWTKLFAGRHRLGRLARRLTGLPTAWQPDPEELTACFASEWLRRKTLERTAWRPGRTTVTYLGIDPEWFTPTAGERPWNWRLLCVGRVEERKGVHVAVEALRLLPEATLDVVGPADERYAETLRRSAEELGVGDRVRLRGAVDRHELPDLYRAADAFVFPVLWEEPFGLVPLEAMACGTPVVATGTGGSAEFLIDRANCLLTARGDAHALAKAVQSLSADATLRSSLVEWGHATVAQLSADKLAAVLEDWHVAAARRFRDGPPADRSVVSVEPSANEPDRDA